MSKFNTIKHVIDQFSAAHAGQVNLGSSASRADLATLIHNALVEDSAESETYNEQQMYLFENITEEKPK